MTHSTSSPSASSHAVPYYVKGLALGIPPYLVAIHFWTWVFGLRMFLAGHADFRQLYAASYMVRTGYARQLYDYAAQKSFQDTFVSRAEVALPFVSPAYHALVFSPLSWLSYPHAYLAFLGINCIGLAVTFRLLRSWMRDLQNVYWWLPITVFLGFLPVGAALIQGQDSVILLTLATGALALLMRGGETAAGVLMGLALFKFQIVLPIVLLFLLWRRGRFLLGFACSALLVSAISVWLVGMEQTTSYVRSLISIAGLKPAGSAIALYPVSLQAMANIHGFIFGTIGSFVGQAWVSAITIVASAIVLIWTAVRGAHVRDSASLLLLAIPCSVLVGHHTYIHDLSILLLPIVLMLGLFMHCEGEGSSPGRSINRIAVVAFVAPVTASFFPNQFYVVSVAVGSLLVAAAMFTKTEVLGRVRA